MTEQSRVRLCSMAPADRMPRKIRVRVRLASGDEITRECVSVSVAVAEFPWPVATHWEVVA